MGHALRLPVKAPSGREVPPCRASLTPSGFTHSLSSRGSAMHLSFRDSTHPTRPVKAVKSPDRGAEEQAQSRELRVRGAPTTIPATDGYLLAATVFEPEGGSTETRTVVIAPATGVKRRYYERFAEFLSEQGLRAVTFDYRGIGDSLRENVRRQAGNMRDWGEKDLAGVLNHVAERFPKSRLVLVGHSAGGQLLGLTGSNRQVGAMLAVGAQSGYWRHWNAPRKFLMASIWYGLVPVFTELFSYFPMRMLKMGENLPAGVALEWARWCRNPQFFVDEHKQPLRGYFEGLRIPIRAYSFEDDTFAPRRAVDALMGFYKDALVDRVHLKPSELSTKAVGHFGFFREKFRDSLWQQSAEWLRTA